MCDNNLQVQLLFSKQLSEFNILWIIIKLNNKTPKIEVNEPIVQIVFKELYISG